MTTRPSRNPGTVLATYNISIPAVSSVRTCVPNGALPGRTGLQGYPTGSATSERPPRAPLNPTTRFPAPSITAARTSGSGPVRLMIPLTCTCRRGLFPSVREIVGGRPDPGRERVPLLFHQENPGRYVSRTKCTAAMATAIAAAQSSISRQCNRISRAFLELHCRGIHKNDPCHLRMERHRPF